MLVGCSLWTQRSNTAAENGVFYALKMESECMAECLTSTSCVAFDLTPVGCTVHNNADDLSTAFYAPGVTQFVLNRHCLPLSTGSTSTTGKSKESTYFTLYLTAVNVCLFQFSILRVCRIDTFFDVSFMNCSVLCGSSFSIVYWNYLNSVRENCACTAMR